MTQKYLIFPSNLENSQYSGSILFASKFPTFLQYRQKNVNKQFGKVNFIKTYVFSYRKVKSTTIPVTFILYFDEFVEQ